MAFKRSAVRSRLSPPNAKSLENTTFSRFFFFACATKQKAFFGCAQASYTPLQYSPWQKILLFNLFLQNIDLVCGCQSAACIRTQAGSTPEDPMDTNDAAPPKLHTVNQECRQFLLLAS